MKLKYIFMFLGVMLLGLTACDKKDTPEPNNKNPFVGTMWESTQTNILNNNGDSEILTHELHFIDDSRLIHILSSKITAKDGRIIDQQNPIIKEELTYTHEDSLATVIFDTVEDGKRTRQKVTLTMDAAKEKITALAEGETETIIYTRKK